MIKIPLQEYSVYLFASLGLSIRCYRFFFKYRYSAFLGRFSLMCWLLLAVNGILKTYFYSGKFQKHTHLERTENLSEPKPKLQQ